MTMKAMSTKNITNPTNAKPALNTLFKNLEGNKSLRTFDTIIKEQVNLSIK